METNLQFRQLDMFEDAGSRFTLGHIAKVKAVEPKKDYKLTPDLRKKLQYILERIINFHENQEHTLDYAEELYKALYE